MHLLVELLAEHEATTDATAGGSEAPSGILSSMNDSATPAIVSLVIKPFDKGDDEFLENPQVLRNRAGTDGKAFLIRHLDGFIAMDIRREGERNEFLALATWPRIWHRGMYLPEIINIFGLRDRMWLSRSELSRPWSGRPKSRPTMVLDWLVCRLHPI